MKSMENENLIKIMANFENLVSQLYMEYSLQLPELRSFWERLSKEELGHEAALNNLFSRVEGRTVFLDNHKFKISSIYLTSKYCSEKIEEAKKGITPIHALSISLDLEKAMIENKYFEVFQSDILELKNTFKTLENETIDHLKRVRDMWTEEREKIGIDNSAI